MTIVCNPLQVQLVNFQKLHVFPNIHQSDETEIEIEVQMRYFCHISAEQMKIVVQGTQNGSSNCLVRDNSRDRGRRGWWQSLTGPQYIV